MKNFKKIIAISILPLLVIGGASLVINSKNSLRVSSKDSSYDIVSLIIDNMTDADDQDVTFVYNGASFTYRLHNVTKDESNLVIDDGYIHNVTALNGLKYVDATALSGNGIMAFGEDQNGTVNAVDRLDEIANYVNSGNATNFAIISNGAATISSIEVSYSCTNGDESLIDTTTSTFSEDFTAFKEFMYIEDASDYNRFKLGFYESGLSYEDYVIYLLDDITLTNFETPIGEFGGDFDGNGYTITSDNTILPSLLENSKVHDLNVVIDMTCVNQFNGGLAQKIGGCAIVSNVHTSGSIKSSSSYTGGLVGIINEGNPIIKDCSSSIAISIADNSSNVGGLVGGTDALDGGLIENSNFTGSLSGKNLSNIGGIAGKTYADISYCNNDGYIEVSTTSNSYYAGGIAGITYGDISYCENTANIRAYYYVGGIAGELRGKIDNCTNSGSISSDEGYVGGISGRNYSTISNSVHSSGTIMTSHGHTGGISGAAYGDIVGCTFKGTISNYYGCAGGITGETYNTNITNCTVTSSAKIQGSYSKSSHIGGLIGNIQGGYVTGCSTEGVVSQSSSDYSAVDHFGGFAAMVKMYKNESGTQWMPVLKDNVKPTNSVFPNANVEIGNSTNNYLGYIFGEVDDASTSGFTIYWAK